MSRCGTIWRTQTAAVMCCYYLRYHGYQPKSILNVGVSSAFEVQIWRWLLPGVPVIGIDPRKKHRNYLRDIRYLQAAATDHCGLLDYCRKCASTRCLEPEQHQTAGYIREVSGVYLDDAAAEFGAPPYFLWMDIDGGELAALRGAEQMLRQTEWLNIEVVNWMAGDAREIEDWLAQHGFKMFFKHHGSDDRLYQQVGVEQAIEALENQRRRERVAAARTRRSRRQIRMQEFGTTKI